MVKVDLTGVKIPKRVGGVKVPKKLRKKGKALIAKANSPAGREAIAAGLAIAGAALAAKGRAKAERAAQAEGAAASDPTKAARGRPGEAGIDPAADLTAAVTSGIAALQKFLAGTGR